MALYPSTLLFPSSFLFPQGETVALLTRTDASGPTGAAIAFVAATAGGDTMVGGQSVKLFVNNASAASITATLVTPETVEGSLAVTDRAVTVAAGAIREIPVPSRYNDPATGLTSITYSAVATVTVGVTLGTATP